MITYFDKNVYRELIMGANGMKLCVNFLPASGEVGL